MLTELARPINPSKGTESEKNWTLSLVATPKEWFANFRFPKARLSVTMSPATCPVPYVIWKGALVSAKVLLLLGPRKLWLPYYEQCIRDSGSGTYIRKRHDQLTQLPPVSAWQFSAPTHKSPDPESTRTVKSLGGVPS